eukprot:TRINITY_DN26210_c1_g2_i1.p6 TRINITY_DN26210_c1_g2~~TRINITY_DN26210_c1_g2_i1.p6  ORF type:complete len:128 (+),score=1.49 TRINITY_DN26210_c1_g2_i1:1254-1637(+)
MSFRKNILNFRKAKHSEILGNHKRYMSFEYFFQNTSKIFIQSNKQMHCFLISGYFLFVQGGNIMYLLLYIEFFSLSFMSLSFQLLFDIHLKVLQFLGEFYDFLDAVFSVHFKQRLIIQCCLALIECW